jgi:hypothetical protein
VSWSVGVSLVCVDFIRGRALVLVSGREVGVSGLK